jgi:putative flippase GtrA
MTDGRDMTATGELRVEGSAGRRGVAEVEIVIPVYNEETDLESSVLRLHEYLSRRFPFSWMITIADNASVDRTWAIACRLAGQFDGVQAIHLDQKGRGRALRVAWLASPAAVVAYMDVDLSTDLDALLPIVAPLLSGHSDLAIGSRLAPGARVVRGIKREIISRIYNVILKVALGNDFSDAQCGFKALRGEVARALLPLIEDDGWFFDTELLVLAEHNGLRIHEVPVDWTDDPDTKVAVADTAVDDLRGIWRLLRRFAAGEGDVPPGMLPTPITVPVGLAGQVVRFVGIGAVSTALFAVGFLLLAPPLGPIGADVVALGLCAGVNVAANRRITFSRRGRPGRLRHYRSGLAVTALPLAVSIATLVILHAAGSRSIGIDLVALSAVNAAAATARFVLLRNWVFKPTTRSAAPPA